MRRGLAAKFLSNTTAHGFSFHWKFLPLVCLISGTIAGIFAYAARQIDKLTPQRPTNAAVASSQQLEWAKEPNEHQIITNMLGAFTGSRGRVTNIALAPDGTVSLSFDGGWIERIWCCNPTK